MTVSAAVAIWVGVGALVGWSEPWRIVMTAGINIATLILVLLLEQTATHETRAIQLKLDELIRAVRNARSPMLRLEELSAQDLDRLEEEFRAIRNDRC